MLSWDSCKLGSTENPVSGWIGNGVPSKEELGIEGKKNDLWFLSHKVKVNKPRSWEGWLLHCGSTMNSTAISDTGSVGGIIIIIIKNPAVYVFVYASVDECRGLPMCGCQRATRAVLVVYFEAGSLLLLSDVRHAGPETSSGSLCINNSTGILGLQTIRQIYMDLGDPDSPHSCAARVLPAEPSPQVSLFLWDPVAWIGSVCGNL